ncbi:outer membrane protein assembly factor BamA [Sphingomonas sp. AOB5]|uniref:outer membrane protein assembly factor BamA n=1 Tax=Sphingomonas sp. AOB5 TaxID=3034017 RepID=UPI0023F97F56|nr:outer membrane protein assembly factor BamA [Sphingomonas sp. AOB5]MDF7773961.1 outer membrane protein assembly factor BamA [Sphingomonas sp. AOB5]
MVTVIKAKHMGVNATKTLLAGTILSAGFAAVPVAAQVATPPAAAAPEAMTVAPPTQRVIRSLRVEGAQRLEPDTILSYTQLRVGASYTNETVDQAIKDLIASDLLADVEIAGVETGDIVIRVRENPIINRVIFEGNKRLKDDKITKEVKLAPRQIFTRTAVRADVARIIELYRRQGRFAANVEPKMVMLDQNRVDVIFEIREGPKSKVRQINIIGNEVFSDGKLRGEMATKQARITSMLSSNTSYDQDRLAYDQQKLRQFYLTEGYADFRVISAIAELTPDKKDFIITYVVEEGPRYKFGPVTVDSAIRDFDDKKMAESLPIREGQFYNAKAVEDSVEALSETAGLFGYAFADVRPEFQRDRENLTMTINFHIAETNRTYIERIDITGNTQTVDKVIRREMRVAEGDAFNTFLVKRSQDRINSLGYFQDKFEIERKEGSAPDRIILSANVEEKATGELTLSAGFSSLERFILQASIRQRNFRGKGQTLSASVDYSSYSKSVELGFTEPYLFDRNIALGATVFRRDYNSFNYIGTDRNTTYSQVSTGIQLVTGVPLTEYWTLSARYTLMQDEVTLDKASFYSDLNSDGVISDSECDPLKAGRYYCDAIGTRITSLVGVSLIYDSLNSRLRPTRGQRLVFGADFAGLGGDVRYARARIDAKKFWHVGSGFIASLSAEGGYIHSFEKSSGGGLDPVRITDRFYLGEPQFRGFDIRGVGPRVQRIGFTGDAVTGNQLLVTDRDQIVDDALGGRGYYLAKAELEIPLGAGAAEMGLRPSIFVQAGALFGIRRPDKTIDFVQRTDGSGNLLFNADGSPSLLPKDNFIKDASGNQLFIVSASDAVNSGQLTTCQVGYTATSGGACSGTSVNAIYNIPTQPFLERFVGDSARPRLAIGVGVNWNSPFGPLRIDVSKALLTQPGDDPKLFTFNVGTQF